MRSSCSAPDLGQVVVANIVEAESRNYCCGMTGERLSDRIDEHDLASPAADA